LAGWLDAGKAAGYPIKLLCAQAIVRAAFAAPPQAFTRVLASRDDRR
jgi:hypothetical protein